MSDLKACYRYHQKRQGVNGSGNRAAASLMLARADVAAGTSRYPDITDYGPKFEAFGESHMRWMENPTSAGLRFAGYADELSPCISHKGWFVDREFQSETARGVVYRLPARKGRARLVYGYADPHNDGPACLCFDAADSEGYAADLADNIAERMAEEESEYQEAWRAGRDYDEMDNTISDIRRSTLALIKEVKAICPSPDTYPETYAALREGITSAIAEIRTLRERRADLIDSYGQHPAWLDS